MRILVPLIPHTTRHQKGMSQGFSNASFPLGVGYVLSTIRKSFPEVEIRVVTFDIREVNTEDEIAHELKEISKSFIPDFILYGAMITRYHYILTLSRIAKRVFPHAIQVLGGGAATWGYYLFTDEAPIDFITIGEAEESIVSILKGDYQGNTGIFCPSDNGKPSRNFAEPVKQSVKNLDIIPMPSHADFPIHEYVEIQKRITGWRTMPIVASRGCPFLCHFCTPSDNSLRMRSADSVIDEMEYLQRNHQVNSIYFWDELQFVHKTWFEKLCQKLVKKNLGLKWVFVTRATLVREQDVPLLRLANQAGCVRVAIGIESGNEKILAAMHKQTSIQQMEDALRRVRKAGIKATGSMLLGFPGENRETVQDSIDFANRNLLETSFYNLIPLPGAEVYDNYCKKKNLIPDEKQYMRQVSLSGGDASNIVMNLTEMSDDVYIGETRRANSAVRNIRMRDALKYYGVAEGMQYSVRRRIAWFKRKLTHRVFDTP